MNAPHLNTPGYSGFNLAFSPFIEHRLALASSANFGLVGNGRVYVLQDRRGHGLAVEKSFDTRDGVFDVAWSETNQNQLASAGGDGSVKLWDVTLSDSPIRNWHEHTREVMGVDWSNLQKDVFASCSWDGSIKLWSPDNPASLQTIPAHSACIYQTLFSPHSPSLLASISADGFFKQFDLRLPPNQKPSIAFRCEAGGGEGLSFDWNKYREGIIATSGTDKLVNIFDLRSINPNAPHVQPITSLQGHAFAVRKVAWSPHRADLIASSGYDMTCKVWSTDNQPQPRLLATQNAHSEFVVGIAWSLYNEGLLMTCGWDGKVVPWRPL
ncbi:WD40-repeat-containing domain protein [Mrakia frigida]|uniref:WD40-repeat-containing domain protein n=1 Tax=Mrakia frigida TaxID=29902 RepID=UPI003FCBFE84